jgi:transcriptional regulator of NAD metabolism
MDERIYDRQMYGAEDNEELDRILDHLERVSEEDGRNAATPDP